VESSGAVADEPGGGVKRPGYREAIQWLLDNDDCDWLDDGSDASLSVTASLVADLFGKTDAQVVADLLRRRTHD